MRTLFVAMLGFILMGCSPASSGQVPPEQDIVRRDKVAPFPEATEVRLLVDSGKHDQGGQPVYTDPEGKGLSAEQRAQLESAVWIETPIKVSEAWGDVTACFIPHHFFEYYDASGRKIGEIQVCFCCAGVQISPDSRIKLNGPQRLTGDFKKLEALVASMGELTDIACH